VGSGGHRCTSTWVVQWCTVRRELSVGAAGFGALFRGGSASCAEAQLGAPAHHPCAVCRIPGGIQGARSYPGLAAYGGVPAGRDSGASPTPACHHDPESQEGDWGLRGGGSGAYAG